MKETRKKRRKNEINTQRKNEEKPGRRNKGGHREIK
jgi:hypothetical protein